MHRDVTSSSPAFRHMAGWILLSFCLWLYCFKGFVSGHLSLQSDAVGYYQHIKFFIDNMVQGVYPFWDPGINGGVPNEFFLRRMGSFNPFLMVPVVLRWCGVSHLIAYTSYLAVYYFMAALGFYGLCRVLLKRPSAAYLGFLLFLFSSLGTRQFDSYIVLVSVPLIWFFTFFLAFFRQPRAVYLVGMTFCLMNLVTTYIPLYFLLIFASFLIFMVILFPVRSLERVREGGAFAWKHKVLVLVCGGCLLLSLVPAAMIFQSAKTGEFVMPRRGATADSQNALVVGKETITDWAMLEELVYTSAFVDLRQFKFAIIYFPGFLYLVLLIGGVVRFNRKLLLLICWGGFLFLLSVPALSPLYDFLHQHIFIFKYFRNLHWFFWLAMLPIFVLSVAMLFDELPGPFENFNRQLAWGGYVIVGHIGFAALVVWFGNTVWSTYVMIGVSLAFFILQGIPRCSSRGQITLLALTVIVGVQGLEVYRYLNENSRVRTGPYKGDRPYDTASFQNDEIMGVPTGDSKPSLYYALRNYHDLYNNTSVAALFGYKRHKFVLFDRVQSVPQGTRDYAAIERMFVSGTNSAYVTTSQAVPGLQPLRSGYENVSAQTPGLVLGKTTVNGVQLQSDYDRPRYLVYNQNWHPGWRVRVNGDWTSPDPVNGSFMGIYLPAGANRIDFRFGTLGFRALHYGLLGTFYGVFIWLLALWARDCRKWVACHGN
ncbi:MAG: hypothetical protein K8I00_09115 [Candidatus Omnitrophica bacterium]|nr:hypothetical protein [Candidatus Omnitrophota bacterium]